MRRALEGVDVAYYLIHSLGTGASFEQRDREAAGIFADAAMSAGVKRIVYLGGIVPGDDSGLSPHLRSRAEVGDILLAGDVPVAALQAAVIIGSGSASFEMLRYLTERLPVMVTPKWVGTRIQPIAVHDVLHYLAWLHGAACGRQPPLRHRRPGRLDVCGDDAPVLRGGWAAAAGSGSGAAADAAAVVAVGRAGDAGAGRPGDAASRIAQERGRVHRARHRLVRAGPARGSRASRHCDRFGAAAHPRGRGLHPLVVGRYARRSQRPASSDPSWAGGSLYVDARISAVRAPPAALWRVIEGIGGETGWYSFPAAWAVRGLLDRLAGGVGLRRGRRDPRHLLAGDALDFWRVEAITPGSLLRLRAEMKLPGLAWLEMAVGRDHDGMTTYSQRAIFQPRGLAGHAYWRSISPFHGVVFGGMLRNITAAAERASRAADKPAPAAH